MQLQIWLKKQKEEEERKIREIREKRLKILKAAEDIALGRGYKPAPRQKPKIFTADIKITIGITILINVLIILYYWKGN